VSVIDKWLNIHRQNAGAATSATPATNRNRPCSSNGLDVASRLLQAATFPPDVATCSNRVATEKPIKGQYLKADVANVANVAEDENRKANTASRRFPDWSTIGSAVCCECGLPIGERLETWWGGERCHQACGEAAFEREKASRGLGGICQSSG
jgi:hypothetical protein